MAHILALRGLSNSGKTTTLRLLLERLRAKYPGATVEDLHPGTKDIKVILRGVKGKIVGIESQGDPSSRLPASLTEFLKKGCDIIFCACRTRGGTVECIEKLSSAHRVEFVEKSRVARGRDDVNAEAALVLLRRAGL